MKLTNNDLIDLRPDLVPLDPAWSQETLTRVMRTESASARAPGARPSKRRLALIGGAVAAISLLGVGAASAAGLMPHAFTETFSYWQTSPVKGHPGVDPATAERIATAPGPDGMVFSVLRTAPGQPYACRTALLESAASAALRRPTSFIDITDNFCSDTPLAPTFGGVDVSYQDAAAGFIVSAGRAVRAEVSTDNGQKYPALLVDGDFWGWFPNSAHPTLIGYAADGSVVGSLRL